MGSPGASPCGTLTPAGAERSARDLSRIAERSALAGRLENTPVELIRWIRHPQAIVPGNVMLMAAYLDTLQ